MYPSIASVEQNSLLKGRRVDKVQSILTGTHRV